MSDPSLYSRAAVLRAYPDAKVCPTAIMYVVRDGGEELGRRATSPERAWINAAALLRANAGAGGRG